MLLVELVRIWSMFPLTSFRICRENYLKNTFLDSFTESLLDYL